MGFIKNVIKTIIKSTLCLAIFVGIIVFVPNLPPFTRFSSIEIEPTQLRVGPLAPNGILNNIEKLYTDKLLGPEAFQLLNGELYTSLATGEIVKVSPGGHVTFVTKIGQPCTGLIQEHICGRPLGFEIDEKNKLLYVADAYYGIWKVDLRTDKKQLLVSPHMEIDGYQPKLFNFLAVDKKRNLYWSDSSKDFQLRDGAISMLTDPSGRLFYYDASKNQSKVLLDNLWFPNGITISPDNQFLVVAESFRYRLLKYYIDGPMKGKSEIFVAGLPGIPDNVRALPDGSGVLVALYTVFDDDHPLLTKPMAATPLARKFLARLQRLIEIPFEYLYKQFPHVVFEEIVHYIGHFKSMSSLAPQMSGLVQIDWNGNIIASYYNTDGTLIHISDAIVYNDKLYLGCPHNVNFISAVPVPPLLKKAFSVTKEGSRNNGDVKPVEVPKQQAQERLKVDEKKQLPKDTNPSTRASQSTQQQKSPERPTTPKPIEKKPTVAPVTAKPTQQPPQQTRSKPTVPKPEEKSKAVPKPVESKSNIPPKPAENKPNAPSKPAESKSSTPPQKAATKPAGTNAAESKQKIEKSGSKQEQSKKTQESVKKDSPKPNDKPLPQQIPIKEEIPSDTIKPNKETLKVIKKGGPAEIPNPNL